MNLENHEIFPTRSPLCGGEGEVEVCGGEGEVGVEGRERWCVEGRERWCVEGRERWCVEGRERWCVEGRERWCVEGIEGEVVCGSRGGSWRGPSSPPKAVAASHVQFSPPGHFYTTTTTTTTTTAQQIVHFRFILFHSAHYLFHAPQQYYRHAEVLMEALSSKAK